MGGTPRSNTAKFVQFWDVRAMQRALEDTGMPFEQGTLKLEEAKSNFEHQRPRGPPSGGGAARVRLMELSVCVGDCVPTVSLMLAPLRSLEVLLREHVALWHGAARDRRHDATAAAAADRRSDSACPLLCGHSCR